MRQQPDRTVGEERVTFELPDAEVALYPRLFDVGEADRLFAELHAGLPWREERIVIFGCEREVPRLVAWHGEPGAAYRYSGVLHEPSPWTPALGRIRERVEEACGAGFNSVLANLYRDNRDGMGWHADDEPELGREPVIASVSLGATRRFRMKHRRDKSAALDLDLGHGSLLVMRGATQHHWRHAVPKTARPLGPRINLTFRRICLDRSPGPRP